MTKYDDDFYSTIRSGCEISAHVVSKIVYDLVKPETVVDIGCGEGHWAKAFETLGADVIGVDGAYVNDRVIDSFVEADLSVAIPKLEKVDLAISLEVAEHLPSSRAVSFIDELCSLSDTILFSAAIPGQGGTNHINEQWPAYWATMFESNGYSVSGALRWLIWSDPDVENWYCQNLLFASSDPLKYEGVFTHPVSDPIPVVHPVLWNHRMGL